MAMAWQLLVATSTEEKMEAAEAVVYSSELWWLCCRSPSLLLSKPSLLPLNLELFSASLIVNKDIDMCNSSQCYCKRFVLRCLLCQSLESSIRIGGGSSSVHQQSRQQP